MKKEVLAALKTLVDNPPKKSDQGICFHVYQQMNVPVSDLFGFLRKAFKGWEHHSGNTSYPIKSANKQCTAEEYYDSHVNLWRGQQKRYRVSLMEYAIKKLEGK